MRVRLTYVLGVSGFISLACAVVVCVLIANFIDDRVNTERAMTFGAAETVVQSGVNALRIDLRRMQLYTGQLFARAFSPVISTRQRPASGAEPVQHDLVHRVGVAPPVPWRGLRVRRLVPVP
jgi:hypothetical protein